MVRFWPRSLFKKLEILFRPSLAYSCKYKSKQNFTSLCLLIVMKFECYGDVQHDESKCNGPTKLCLALSVYCFWEFPLVEEIL